MRLEQVEQFLSEFTTWAATQPDIQAVALVGSYARNAAKETSDVDLVLIVDQPRLYLDNSDWAQRFGVIQRQQVEDYGPLISSRIEYADGREVEYGITDERWAALPLDEGSRQVIDDGMRILFERGPILSRHQTCAQR